MKWRKKKVTYKKVTWGGSESSALDRTKVRSIALEQNRVVRARSALWACFVALCARAYMNAIPFTVCDRAYRSTLDRKLQKIKTNKKNPK
jgi:hypothetical protein